MKAVLQRVHWARVSVDDEVIGQAARGLLAYVAVAAGDTEDDVEKLAEKVAEIRIFEDDAGKMNLSVRDVRGGILVIPNFTLAADTRKGRRPSFDTAAPPQEARELFAAFVSALKARQCDIEVGRFGGYMVIESAADGPVNVIVDTRLGTGKSPEAPDPGG